MYLFIYGYLSRELFEIILSKTNTHTLIYILLGYVSHKTHPFKVYSSVVFGIFRVMKPPPPSNFGTCLTFWKETECNSSPSFLFLPLSCPPPVPGTIQLLSVSVGLPLRDTSYKRNHAMHGFVTSFFHLA